MSQGADAAERRPLLAQLAVRLPPALRDRAFTHASWVERRVDSYERLEFLGDSVLGVIVAADIYERFPDFEEGRLAKLKAYVVSRRSCGIVARRLHLDELVAELAPGTVDQRLELSQRSTALGNILEALIGASYLAFGFETVRAAVMEAFAEQITYGLETHIDYKSTLQEYLALTERAASYRLVLTEGPPHERLFTSEVVVGKRVRGRGTGRTIKRSEQDAAHAALVDLGLLAAPPDPGSTDPAVANPEAGVGEVAD